MKRVSDPVSFSQIAGSLGCNTNYDPPATIVTFTASASASCLNGGAAVTNPDDPFTGNPVYTTIYNRQTHLWQTMVSQGTFTRDVQASSTWTVGGGTASQFYNMIVAEEQYHEQQQMENAGHVRWGTAFLTANIMSAVRAAQPYTASTQVQSLLSAQLSFDDAVYDEVDRSWDYLDLSSILCADETEAKTAASSSHILAMPCAYPQCP